MNFTPHHLIISKILNRLTFLSGNFYRLLPVKKILSLKTRSLGNYNVPKIKNILRENIGDFSGFSEYCDSSDRDTIVALADQALAHEFDLLGSGPVKLDPIDWHCDFKSGFRWPPRKFYKRYVTTDYSNNSDVKVSWELSRCHHLLWLGQAYLLSGDEKYAEEIVFQIDNWIDENPLMYSINWTCAMDVAIRAINWLYAVNMIIDSKSMRASFTRKFTKSLYGHGFFIFRNLEKNFPYSKNHYAADITGLLFIGQFFIDTGEGKKWWNFSLREFFSEIRTQVLPSGVHFERSTSYHRLMTELFFYPYLLLKRVGAAIPLDIKHRVQSMCDFILYYSRPDGSAPNIGDNDDGRLLPFIKYDFDDHRYLLSLSSIEFSSPFYKKYADGLCVDAFFLMTANAAGRFNAVCSTPYKISSRLFPDAGFCIIRHENFYMFISNSELSGFQDVKRNLCGTHTHADLLSFELAIGDTTFIVDPGSYVYTASIKERNQFRGTSCHNTLTVDDLDQHKLSENAFIISKPALPIGLQYSEDENDVVVEGAHDGYTTLDSPVVHKREIRFDKNTLNCSINDQLDFVGRHKFSWHFHFHPEISLTQVAGGLIAKSDKGHSLRIDFECVHSLNFEIMECHISRSYGVKERSNKLKITANADTSFEMKTGITVLSKLPAFEEKRSGLSIKLQQQAPQD